MISPKQLSPFMLFILACLPLGSRALALSSLTSIQQQLELLETQTKAFSVHKDKSPIGLVSFAADQQFQLAEQSFREREYIATIRSINLVLNQLPQLNQTQYLKSQYLLGRSYEELAFPARAVKAYLRYISSYASQGGGSDEGLLEVTKRLLLLEEYMLTEQKDAFQRLLANLMSLPLHRELKDEVTLLSSIAAYHGNRHRLASDWLTDLRRPGVSQHLQVEGAFYEALTALALGQDAEGEKRLLEVADFKEPSFLFIRDVASLNLARLYAARQMPQNAWSWYQKVEGPGASLRYAAFEAVALLQQSREYAKALQLAKAYIGKYPKTAEAHRLQERLSYLQMQAGQLDPAEGEMRNRERDLHSLQSDLIASFRGRERLTGKDVKVLQSQTAVMALHSTLLDTSDRLFERLQKAEMRLSEQRQELASSIFILGRVSDARLRPEVAATNRQFQSLVSQLFNLGEQLIQHEQEIFAKQLSPAEKIRLERSTARRQKLLGLDQEFQKADWQSWERFSQTHLLLARMLQKLSLQRASLQGIEYTTRASKADTALAEKIGLAQDLLKRLAGLEERVNNGLEQSRLAMLQQIRRPSPYQKTRKVLLLGAQEFLESLSLFDEYHDRFQHPMNQHLQEDIERSWKQWQAMAGHILKLIKQDESEQANWLEQQLAEIRKLQSKEDALLLRHQQLVNALAESTARALPAILDHFDHHIKEQQSRAKKWLADLQWQRYMTQTEQRLNLKAEHDQAEVQIQENLKDLETERSIHE